MYFLFSGEGATDIGESSGNAMICDKDCFSYGPMVVIVDQIVEARHNYSLLETGCYGFVSRGKLVAQADALKPAKKSLRLAGKKRAKETQYFFTNARMLAIIAKDLEDKLNDEVVAVLFRDADTATAGRGPWEQKRQSMLDGFSEVKFTRGIPMIPKPTSEAWLLCALQKNPYQGCARLENRSGSSKSPHSLKGEVEKRLGHQPTRDGLCDMVDNGKIDHRKIDMPSLIAFRERLEEVI